MFEALSKTVKPIKAARRAENKKVAKPVGSILSTANRTTNAVLALHRLVAKLQVSAEAFNNVRHLKAVCASDGMSPQLIKFVNRDGGASNLIKHFPAVEKMDNVVIGAKDRRVARACEDMDEVLDTQTDVVEEFVDESCDGLKDLFESVKEQLENIDATHEQLEEALEDMEVNEELLKTVMVHTCSAESLFKIFGLLEEALKLLSDKEGENEEAELRKVIELLDEFTGLSMDDDAEVSMEPGDTEEMHEPSSKSLMDHGYTPEKIHELLDRAGELAADLDKLVDRHGEIAGYFQETVDELKDEDGEAESEGEKATEEGAAPAEEGVKPVPAKESVEGDEGAPGEDTSGMSGAEDHAEELQEHGEGGEEIDEVHTHISGCVVVITTAVHEALSAISMAFVIVEAVVRSAPVMAPEEEHEEEHEEPPAEEHEEVGENVNLTE